MSSMSHAEGVEFGYSSFPNLGTEKKSVWPFDFFFYARNDSATAFPATHQTFSGERQLFLKFSNFCKKIDFEAFFMHILAIGAI